jgi:tRNA dimethylallyltransferase
LESVKILIVIIGPTAVGKTEVAIRLAEQLGTEIVSADSRQFYREMNIGTAKPSAAQLKKVPHHFIDSHSITENYNAGKYAADAQTTICSLFEKYDNLVLTGGSGMYIKAVCYGMDELPESNPHIRTRLNQECEINGIAFLQDRLKMLDPGYYQSVDKNNPRRLIRALEVCLITGQPYSSFLGKKKPLPENITILKIGLDRTREDLYERINLRIDRMMEHGLEAEARSLLPYKHHPALQTVGYQELFEYFDGTITKNEAVDKIKQNTRNLAKRQMTWFRKDKEIQWHHPEELLSKPLRSIFPQVFFFTVRSKLD